MSTEEFSKTDNNGTVQGQGTKRLRIPKYLTKMNEIDKAANNKIIKSMEKKISFLKNPRFRINRPPILFQQEATSVANDTQDPFRVTPETVTFTDYKLNCVYEILLTLTNASGISRRLKYMPPATPEFSVSKAKYPLDTGMIAPGMCVVLTINFLATSLSDFDDELLIVSEESSFKVKLQARKEHANLTLPEILDCQSCWLGDRIDMAFPFVNKGGEASFKFFCENEEDDHNQSGDILKIHNFTVYPSEFFIGKGQTMELFVSFLPQRDGLITEKVILACDDNTSKIYNLSAKANMAELNVASLNKIQISSEAPLKKIYFDEVWPGIPKSNILTIRNDTSVKVNFHWTIQQGAAGDPFENRAKFKIEPEKGVFQGNGTVDFKLTFSADISMAFYKNISLIIDDIPIQGIRNPPELIKKQYLEQKSASKELVRPSITYFEFDLCGIVNFNTVQIQPPLYIFPSPLVINKTFGSSFKIMNHSNGEVNYSVEFYNKTSDIIQYELGPPGNTKGSIKPNEDKLIEVKIWASKPRMNQKCVFLIKFENSDPQTFEIFANFTGPQISLKQPTIDFGLIKTYTTSVFDLEIENLTEIPTALVIKKMNDKVSFEDFTNPDDPYYQWWDEKIYFNPQYYMLSPLEKHKIQIKLNATHAETIEEFIEILVLEGKTEIIQLKAEVQDIHVTINRYLIEFPVLYAGNSYNIHENHDQAICLQNTGNIPAKFVWTDVDLTEFVATFTPRVGIIKPKSTVKIALKFTPKAGQKLYQLFACDVEGYKDPLGFELISQVDGLSVTYEIFDEAASLQNPNASFMSQNRSQRSHRTEKSHNVSHYRPPTGKISNTSFLDEDKAATPFEKIELLDLHINQPKIFKFSLKNTSGIKTKYHFYMENFEPLEHKEQAPPKSSTQEKQSLTSYDLSKATRTKFSQTSSDKESRPPDVELLTDEIERTHNYTSANGQAMNQAKMLDKDQKFYLTNNKGVAVVCEPTAGVLNAKEEILVTCTVYNDTCGKFMDYLCSDIRGLELVKFPVRLHISGSPLIVTPNQVGVDYSTDYPTMTVAKIMRNSPSLSRSIKLTNTGPNEMMIEWKVFDLGNEDRSQDFFNIKLIEPDIGRNDIAKLEFEPIEPKESENGPFTITPKVAEIQGRATESFKITFSGKELGDFKGVLVAKPRIINSENSERNRSDIGSQPVYVSSVTVFPVLKIDKRSLLDGSHKVRFEKWALSPNLKQEKVVILKNKTVAPLIFHVQISGPFKLVSSKTNSPNKHELAKSSNSSLKPSPEVYFNLAANTLLELTIRFEGFPEKDHEEWPLGPSLHTSGSLQINYANNDTQLLELEGILLRPIVQLNTAGFEGKPLEEVQNFGTVHINNIKQKVLFLYNLTTVPGKWKINYVKYPVKKIAGLATITKLELEDNTKTDDPSVFEFSISEGVIQGPTQPVNVVPPGSAFAKPNYSGTVVVQAPQKLIISFQPKKNIMYKSKYRITIEEGPNIDFVLKGFGSYEEHLEK